VSRELKVAELVLYQRAPLVDVAGAGVGPVALVADSVFQAVGRGRVTERVVGAGVGEAGCQGAVGGIEASEHVTVTVCQDQTFGGAVAHLGCGGLDRAIQRVIGEEESDTDLGGDMT
jgi:hypothetical protein